MFFHKNHKQKMENEIICKKIVYAKYHYKTINYINLYSYLRILQWQQKV